MPFTQPTPLAKIDVGILETFDRSGLANVYNIETFIRALELILDHRYPIKPHPHTLAELVPLEVQGKLPSPFRDKLLAKMTEELLAISGPHLKDIRAARALLEKFITQWATQRNKLDTPLMAWSAIGHHQTEEEFFKANVLTLELMQTFMLDLHLFLSDLVYSCPHSYARYIAFIQEHKLHEYANN